MRRLPSLVCLLVLAMLGKGSLAAAGNTGPAQVSLSLNSNDVLPDCLGLDQLAAGIEQRLGRNVFAAQPQQGSAASHLAISVHLALVSFQVWDVELTTKQTSEETSAAITGRRSLRLKAPTCEDLLAPLTFIVTLTIDPKEVSTAAPVIVTQPVVARPLPLWRFSVGAGMGVVFGSLPGAALLGNLRVLTMREGWPAIGLAFGLQNSSSSFASGDWPREGKASFYLWNAGVEVLPKLWRRLYGVGSVRCQVVRAEGSGFDQNRASTTYGCSTGVGLLTMMPVSSRISLFLEGNVAVPWQRSRYVFTNATGQNIDGFHSASLSAGATAGLIIAF